MAQLAVTNTQDSPTSDAEPIDQQFFLWTLAALNLPVNRDDHGVYQLSIPGQDREDHACSESRRFTFDELPAGDATTAERFSLCGSLFDWAIERVRGTGNVVHSVPAAQPASVHQLTSRLFGAYTVEGGNVRLGGCTMEDQPLVRYTYRIRSTHDSTLCRLAHVYVSIEGQLADDDLIASLHVHELEPYKGKPPRVPAEEMARWIALGRQRTPAVSDGEQAELLVVTVVWCKYVRCKLIFELGSARAELPFQGWAQWLVDGRVEPPQFRCSETGRSSYHLTATDDGRVTVPEAIAVCDKSGLRVLESDVETCDATGSRALPEFMRPCPVTAQKVLRSAMIECSMCRHSVSPTCVESGRCQACRTLKTTGPDDPRLVRVLGAYARLKRWSRWRIAETDVSYILTATSLFRSLLLVLDKDSLEAMHLAESSRFARRWSDVSSDRWAEYLR